MEQISEPLVSDSLERDKTVVHLSAALASRSLQPEPSISVVINVHCQAGRAAHHQLAAARAQNRRRVSEPRLQSPSHVAILRMAQLVEVESLDEIGIPFGPGQFER